MAKFARPRTSGTHEAPTTLEINKQFAFALRANFRRLRAIGLLVVVERFLRNLLRGYIYIAILHRLIEPISSHIFTFR
jgi:hypothetical protein